MQGGVRRSGQVCHRRETLHNPTRRNQLGSDQGIVPAKKQDLSVRSTDVGRNGQGTNVQLLHSELGPRHAETTYVEHQAVHRLIIQEVCLARTMRTLVHLSEAVRDMVL